jgi:beta-lactamase class A
LVSVGSVKLERRWFGVNDIDKFYPASLIKLPIAVMYYKIAELEPEIFDKKLQIPADAGDNSDQHYPPADPMVPGQYYTVREMIRHMLVYSDNAPFTPLADSAGLFREKVLSDLNIYEPPAGEGEGAWSVTARNYGNIFRMLYNASYLNIDYANEMLGILSESTFKKGIVAGVPDGVKVAHKFGEAAGTDQDGKVLSLVLNDCGIIYKPNAPYILCTMTEGTDYPQMEKVIQKIAKASYDALE